MSGELSVDAPPDRLAATESRGGTDTDSCDPDPALDRLSGVAFGSSVPSTLKKLSIVNSCCALESV